MPEKNGFQLIGDWKIYLLDGYEIVEIDERRITQWPMPSKCDHEWTAKDEHHDTICSKCGEAYT